MGSRVDKRLSQCDVPGLRPGAKIGGPLWKRSGAGSIPRQLRSSTPTTIPV